jgi:DNA-directed RNA polymerase specialized sigma24 family protein
MSTTGPTEPTDYARLTDADLIHRLCAGQDGRAENELLARYAPRIECVVLGEVRRLHMPRSDWDDALQVGRFDLRTAAASYAAAGTSPETGPSFEGLLTCVVTTDTRDMARHLRRDASHYGRPGHGPWGADPSAAEPVAVGSDPALLAERHEFLERFYVVLDRLGPDARELVERCAAGQSRHEAAEAMGLSRRRARALWEQTVEALREEFTDWME